MKLLLSLLLLVSCSVMAGSANPIAVEMMNLRKQINEQINIILEQQQHIEQLQTSKNCV